jgi:hypothetical protein
MSLASVFSAFIHCFRALSLVVVDLVRLASLAVHSHSALAAENLFLRKQLAMFQERNVKPRRADEATRWMMATLSRMFPWGNSLVNVKPDTLIRWQRKGFRLFLALEVQTNRKTSLAQGPPKVDPGDGCAQPDLGRGTYRQRVATETRDSRIAPDRREVPACRPPSGGRAIPSTTAQFLADTNRAASMMRAV